ncbi:MAG: amidohydrolase [Clostridia bacterium]|nr:amidohydrolase [Clostridia bacterium]
MLTDKQKDLVLAAERHIWANPETGFREVKTTAYLLGIFRELGYTPVEASGITGFYADLDTGRPGPTIAVMGELDSLICRNHPDADPVTGAVHACGHNAQCATLVGVAAAMRNPGALDGLCGKIRFMAVPAEELIELGFREGLREQGIIEFFGGKMEFVRRGYFDGVDMAMMIHTAGLGEGQYLHLNRGNNGCVVKQAIFQGKSAHAGGAPQQGINALYAATNAINAANALRETFTDQGQVRYHPIITEGGMAVNAIPERVVTEAYVRGADIDVIRRYNRAINRAVAASAAAMGAGVKLIDRLGYFPLNNCDELGEVMAESMRELAGPDSVVSTTRRSSGSTDAGDISSLMPMIHPHSSGSAGTAHGDDYRIVDPYAACVRTAECIEVALGKLLSNEGARARAIKAAYKPIFASKEEYYAAAAEFRLDLDAVTYHEDGGIALTYMNKT